MRCPYCGSYTRIVDASIVYGRNGYGRVCVCSQYPFCDAYVGVHQVTGEPLGTLADSELREWRKRAHAAFDPAWQSGPKDRREAYQWLARLLNLRQEEAHIAQFDVAQCQRTIRVIDVMKRKGAMA